MPHCMVIEIVMNTYELLEHNVADYDFVTCINAGSVGLEKFISKAEVRRLYDGIAINSQNVSLD